jgi:radical SAM superfamily enzyme YgiQ (UPF0313 family)
MRIILVEPRPAGHNVYDLALLPRLGLPLIGRLLTQAGHEVTIYGEVLAPIDIGECLSADLVGISSTTATQPSAYRLADLLGASGVPVVLGGPHVSFRTDEALAHAPYVVRGEGHATMLELVSHLESGRPLEGIRGLAFRGKNGEPVSNPARPATSQAEFLQLPPPDLSLIAGHERMPTKPIMTQWGCPFDCEFCSVTAVFGRHVRHRTAGQVVAELASLNAERVFFYDDNFVVNKARARELLNAMVSNGVTLPWFAQVRADVVLRSLSRPEVDKEFLSLMRSSGATMVMIGFEAITDEGLAAIGKRLNVATAKTAVHALHDHGIAVHGMFVAGLDTDDATTAPATADFARRLGIDTFQLMTETPLPGTRLWERLSAEGRILSDDWSLFDGHQVVMRPARMTPLDLQLGVLEAMRRFYSWPRIVRSGVAGALSHLPDLLAAGRPALIGRLPTLAKMARAKRWTEIAPLLRVTLPDKVRARATAALWLPALRFYARRQLSAWKDTERARAHLELLASLR